MSEGWRANPRLLIIYHLILINDVYTRRPGPCPSGTASVHTFFRHDVQEETSSLLFRLTGEVVVLAPSPCVTERRAVWRLDVTAARRSMKWLFCQRVGMSPHSNVSSEDVNVNLVLSASARDTCEDKKVQPLCLRISFKEKMRPHPRGFSVGDEIQ